MPGKLVGNFALPLPMPPTRVMTGLCFISLDFDAIADHPQLNLAQVESFTPL